ncbi:hypothetical protein ACJX0J_026027, partial [Zea mays]
CDVGIDNEFACTDIQQNVGLVEQPILIFHASITHFIFACGCMKIDVEIEDLLTLQQDSIAYFFCLLRCILILLFTGGIIFLHKKFVYNYEY